MEFYIYNLAREEQFSNRMRYVAILVCILLVGCGDPTPVAKIPITPEGQYDYYTNELAKSWNGITRPMLLGPAAKAGFTLGKIDEARKFATELLDLTNKPSYMGGGDAVVDANFVLGRIAAKEGRVDEAKNRLIESGKTSGSPTLSSFGPNMSLAADLLKIGERDVVLRYFELCRKFWQMDRGKLDQWA